MSVAVSIFFYFASGSFALDFLFVDRVVEVDGTFLGPLSCSSTACMVSFAFSMVTAVSSNDISCFSFCDWTIFCYAIYNNDSLAFSNVVFCTPDGSILLN